MHVNENIAFVLLILLSIYNLVYLFFHHIYDSENLCMKHTKNSFFSIY